MRQLLPTSAEDVDEWDAYWPGEGTEMLRVNMISSLDGAISVHGGASGLGSPDDRRIFNMLRAQADVVVVGARTVSVEDYGPVRLRDENAARRLESGLTKLPRIAVVSGTADLDFGARFFRDAGVPPLVLTTEKGAESAREVAGDRAELIAIGPESVDLGAAVQTLRGHGYRHILCEGGPTLNGQLLEQGLIDELCLTLAPVIVQGDGARIMQGPARSVPQGFETMCLLEESGYLFMRLRRLASGQ